MSIFRYESSVFLRAQDIACKWSVKEKKKKRKMISMNNWRELMKTVCILYILYNVYRLYERVFVKVWCKSNGTSSFTWKYSIWTSPLQAQRTGCLIAVNFSYIQPLFVQGFSARQQCASISQGRHQEYYTYFIYFSIATMYLYMCCISFKIAS